MFVFLNWRPGFVVVCVRRLRNSVEQQWRKSQKNASRVSSEL